MKPRPRSEMKLLILAAMFMMKTTAAKAKERKENHPLNLKEKAARNPTNLRRECKFYIFYMNK